MLTAPGGDGGKQKGRSLQETLHNQSMEGGFPGLQGWTGRRCPGKGPCPSSATTLTLLSAPRLLLMLQEGSLWEPQHLAPRSLLRAVQRGERDLAWVQIPAPSFTWLSCSASEPASSLSNRRPFSVYLAELLWNKGETLPGPGMQQVLDGVCLTSLVILPYCCFLC